ncbi:MAG: hypothetical protein QXG35_09765 [Nitrososphaerota archaeon]
MIGVGGEELMGVDEWEVLEKGAKSLELAGRILEVLEREGISVEDLYLALPSLMAVLAMGAGKNAVEALRFTDLLCNTVKELIANLYGY